MRTPIASLLLGAAALTTALAAERLIAPFYGLGPLLTAGSLGVGLAALALGVLWRPSRPGPGELALIAAALSFLAPWVRTPLLAGLEAAGLRVATLGALAVLAGLPLLLLGAAIAGAAREEGGARRALAPALLGAALAAPLVVWLLLPAIGVARTLLAAGAAEVLAGWLLFRGPAARTTAIAGLVLLGLGGSTAPRFPAAVKDAEHGLVDQREGRAHEYRVLTHTDGRYLVADGTIQTLLSAETNDPQMRPSVAFRIVDLMAARDSMLVLGLRGGGVGTFFAREGWRVRIVEPDPTAIAVAEADLSFHAAEVPVELADVRTWCRTHRGRWPVILFDAYTTSALPPHLASWQCFATIKQRLTPEGMLLMAVLASGWDDPIVAALAATLRTQFRHVLALPTSEPPNTLGSILLMAADRPLDLSEDELPDPVRFLMNPEEHWAVVQVNHAWMNRYEPKPAAVLSDDRSGVETWSDRVQLAAHREAHALFRGPRRTW